MRRIFRLPHYQNWKFQDYLFANNYDAGFYQGEKLCRSMCWISINSGDANMYAPLETGRKRVTFLVHSVELRWIRNGLLYSSTLHRVEVMACPNSENSQVRLATQCFWWKYYFYCNCGWSPTKPGLTGKYGLESAIALKDSWAIKFGYLMVPRGPSQMPDLGILLYEVPIKFGCFGKII